MTESSSTDEGANRLEARLATAEAQIETLQERVAELGGAIQRMRSGALWTRIFLLIAAIAAFFFVRSFGG